MSDKAKIGAVVWQDLTVEDVDKSAARCLELGGQVYDGRQSFLCHPRPGGSHNGSDSLKGLIWDVL
jgi:hypothetical protein